jgi:hypothetical protein
MPEPQQQETPAGTEVTPGVWVLPGQGNAFAVEAPDGVVLVDTGPGGSKTDEPAVIRARTIKADLCRARSKEIDPYPSKGLYKSSAKLLREGITSWEGVNQ